MRIAICDDERHFREALKQMFDAYARKRLIDVLHYEYKNGESLLKSDRKYDLIFLDYQMGDLNGVETAKKLRKNNCRATIVFMSSYPHVVFDTFEVNTFRFLTKPVVEGRLFKVLDDYLKSFSKSEYLMIKRPNISRVRFDDIIYIEAHNKTSAIHTVDEVVEYVRFISEVEKSLPKDRFFKCHKSYIVGLKHVKGRFERDLLLDNGAGVPLAAGRTSDFIKVFSNYMKRYVFEPDDDEG